MQLPKFRINYVYASVFAANILAVITGMSLAWPSPIIQKLRNQNTPSYPFSRSVTENELSLISSLLQCGAIFGSVIFGAMSHKLGRKTTILSIAIPYLIAYTILVLAQEVYLYMLARLIAGISVGATFMVLPNYIGEICYDYNRGRLTSSTTSFVTLGLLVSYASGPFISMTILNLIILSTTILFIPLFYCIALASPYFLISSNRIDEAILALSKLRGQDKETAINKLDNIKKEIEKCQGGSIFDIFNSVAGMRALFMTTALIILQQLSGINIILSRSERIFEVAGTKISHKLCPIIVASVQLATCYITPLLADKAGRKLLLSVSSTGTCAALCVLGTYFFLKDVDLDVNEIHWVPIITLVCYIIAYNCGLGAIPWAIMGELYPMNVKSFGSSVTTMVYWLIGFMLNLNFTSLKEEIGFGTSFWIFAGACLITDMFVYLFLIETKGKSLEEIQNTLRSKNTG